MTVRVHHGDMLDVLPTLADAFDSCVCDPPYGISFMGRGWDHAVPGIAYWREVYRVLKPGAHLLAFSGTRTYHRMACAIEDAGFEIRDTIMWVYGSGFPKSHDVAKGIDKAAGVEGGYGAPKSAAHAGWIERGGMRGEDNAEGWQRPWMQDAAAVDRNARQYEPGTEDARRWQGWGTALKPAVEPICMARKPLAEKTVAANVLAHGTGALNIDACRVEGGESTRRSNRAEMGYHGGNIAAEYETGSDVGRWPANLLHDGSDEVMEAFARFGERATSGNVNPTHQPVGFGGGAGRIALPINHADSGTAARFFYTAKADASDRLGSKHPTVKPVDLMAYLCRLVTPPGGLVLDCFAGSGTTGMACLREGFNAVLIEREAEYVADIERRLKHVSGEDSPLFAGVA